MSDSSSSTNDRVADAHSIVAKPLGSALGRTSIVKSLFVVNGLICFVLVAAWMAFGSRGRNNSEETKPFASATDTTDEDDDNGRPKVMQIEMKWSEAGIADFEFTERSGKTIRNEDLAGHPWVVSFIFTNCAGPCFRVTSAMRRLQDEFFKDTDLRLVTITVDPERDSPTQLAKYANGFGADHERWLFLTDPTGQKDKIYPLIWGSFLMPVQEATGEMRIEGHEFIHTNNVLLVDERGVVQGKWNSIDDASFDKLRRKLRKRFKPTKGGWFPEQMTNAELIPDWVMWLPAVNAFLNGVATVLLVRGWQLIHRGQRVAHKQTMLAAFGVSVAFLACYLTYHFALQHYTGSGSKKFEGVGLIRPIYFTILISHIVLAGFVPFLAGAAIWLGLRADKAGMLGDAATWRRHRQVAKVTFPVWLYVSVTGVVIYFLAYHWPSS